MGALAGCSGDNTDPADANGDEEGGEPGVGPQQEEEDSEPEYDAVIDYSVHLQDSADGEYELPEHIHGWSWIVVDIEVLEGEFSMQEAWFNGLFETEERFYTVSHSSDDVANGIESRGAIPEGGRGIILHDYPPSPASDLVGPAFSAMGTSIGGDGVNSGPNELNPPVSVEYSIERAQNPDVLSDEEATEDGNEWAVVTLDVVDGLLNFSDVWFRSELTTDSRIHTLDHTSQFAEYGTRPQGLVKPGHSTVALYQIGEDETIEEWRYTEDARQDASVSRS